MCDAAASYFVCNDDRDKQWRMHSDGDVIKMRVDIPDRSVTFWSITKGEKVGTYSDIDFSMKYRFAVSMISGNSIRLLSVKFVSHKY